MPSEDLQINKRLKRAADYTFAPKNEKTGKRKGKVILFTFDKPSDETYKKVGEVTPEVAHKWIMGNEDRDEVPATDPTVDEMIEAITERLRKDCEFVINAALHDEDSLKQLYRASKATTSAGGSNFILVRPCW